MSTFLWFDCFSLASRENGPEVQGEGKVVAVVHCARFVRVCTCVCLCMSVQMSDLLYLSQRRCGDIGFMAFL